MIMSALDAAFTLLWIRQGSAEEVNPLLNYFLSFGESWFVAGKTILTLVGCFILYKSPNQVLARKAALSLAAFYICLIFYHLFGGIILA